jgi:hypothetical protein
VPSAGSALNREPKLLVGPAILRARICVRARGGCGNRANQHPSLLSSISAGTTSVSSATSDSYIVEGTGILDVVAGGTVSGLITISSFAGARSRSERSTCASSRRSEFSRNRVLFQKGGSHVQRG